jgi:hypothetical protein
MNLKSNLTLPNIHINSSMAEVLWSLDVTTEIKRSLTLEVSGSGGE